MKHVLKMRVIQLNADNMPVACLSTSWGGNDGHDHAHVEVMCDGFLTGKLAPFFGQPEAVTVTFEAGTHEHEGACQLFDMVKAEYEGAHDTLDRFEVTRQSNGETLSLSGRIHEALEPKRCAVQTVFGPCNLPLPCFGHADLTAAERLMSGSDALTDIQHLANAARDATAMLRTESEIGSECNAMAERLYNALKPFSAVPWDDKHFEKSAPVAAKARLDIKGERIPLTESHGSLTAKLTVLCAVLGPNELENADMPRGRLVPALRLAKEALELARAKSLTPPLVNGRPSCCKDASDTEHLFKVPIYKWVVGVRDRFRPCSHCPFCGTKLPEVPT